MSEAKSVPIWHDAAQKVIDFALDIADKIVCGSIWLFNRKSNNGGANDRT